MVRFGTRRKSIPWNRTNRFWITYFFHQFQYKNEPKNINFIYFPVEGNLVPPQDNSDPEHSWTIKTVNNCRIVSASEAIPLIEYSDK